MVASSYTQTQKKGLSCLLINNSDKHSSKRAVGDKLRANKQTSVGGAIRVAQLGPASEFLSGHAFLLCSVFT